MTITPTMPVLLEEQHPTPEPAPDRVDLPSGRRSPAPAPTATDPRARAAYWATLTEIEANARMGCWCARCAAYEPDGCSCGDPLRYDDEIREPMDEAQDFESLPELMAPSVAGSWLSDLEADPELDESATAARWGSR